MTEDSWAALVSDVPADYILLNFNDFGCAISLV
jgi:hypothetical protein